MPPPMPSPPAPPLAWLLMMLLEATLSVPWLKMPPPATAELPLTVQLVSVVVTERSVVQAAAVAGGGVAADRAVGQRWSCRTGCAEECPAAVYPPPLAAELPLTVQLVSVVVPADVSRPPPLPMAVLPLTVQLFSVVVPGEWCRTQIPPMMLVGVRSTSQPPPPWPAELPLTVQLVSVVVPRMLHRPPPPVGGGVAADGAVGQRGRAASCYRPPPIRVRRSCR